MKAEKLFYMWIASWLSLELVGMAVFQWINQSLGLIFMLIGVADILMPYVAYAQDVMRKKINRYFEERKKK